MSTECLMQMHPMKNLTVAEHLADVLPSENISLQTAYSKHGRCIQSETKRRIL